MKKRFAIILALGMLFLSACSEVPTIEINPDISQTESGSEPETEQGSEVLADNHSVPDSPESEDAVMLEQAKAITPESGISKSGPAEKQKETTSIIVEFEEKKHAEEQDKPVQSSAPTATPAPASKPKEDEGVNSKLAQIPEATSDPTPNPQPESIPEPESEPAFDISYWVSFAKTYGQQIGLSYDSQATDCWDNPILASPKSIYLERDISSRLSRYVREGMTAFCVWSEQLPDGRYNIYIGYA